VAHEVVNRQLDRLAALERPEVLDEQLGIERRGVIEVVALDRLRPAPLEVPVVVVLGQECDALAADGVEDRARHGGLARPRSAGDAQRHDTHDERILCEENVRGSPQRWQPGQ
jgi:hypothetical protein